MSEAVMLWISDRNDREDPALRSFLEAAEKEVNLHALAERALPEFLETREAHQVIGAIVAPSVQSPIAAARAFLRRLPGREVIFISSAETEEKRDANVAFLYGHQRTIAAADVAEGVKTIRRLLEQARRQRKSRWALARMNEQIAQARDETVKQKRLAISDRLLASILAQSPDALFALDLDGFLLAVNRAAVENFNLAEAEGSHFEDTALAEKLPDLRGLVAAATAEMENRRQEIVLPPPEASDAESVTLEASASPVFDEQNRLIGITVLLRDVSRLKMAERSLREMNEALEHRVNERTHQLKEANLRMESFLYSLAHDLRTPIRAIAGFTQILQEDYGVELREEAQDLMRRIFQATQRMDLLINDLLAYSRVAKIHLPLEPVELNAVLETAQSAVAEQAANSGAEIRIESSPGAVLAHQTTLEQVIINLLSNALHYARPEKPSRVRVFSEWKEGRCRLWIQDNGIGIDPGYHEKIFEIFERVSVSSNPTGTGIGLAIVKGGSERMGGSAGVESEPGKGSSFWIELAAAPTVDSNAPKNRLPGLPKMN